MASKSQIFIAGVGYTPVAVRSSLGRDAFVAQVSAATKALLDAGVTSDDVDQGVISTPNTALHCGPGLFETFDGGIPVSKVKSGSEIDTSLCLIRDRVARCVLMIAIEEVCSR